ncbi:hypothetical protein KIL84_009707 [Mauremys mutica]|uniref:Uncharacterized protein n=1 Tax=Mauremys mutica TaxID=74926 RepID=A0A9D3XL91_9SAUR|nr:hypothetical protein KIL84_009707 [Mauremys mutica]
MPGTGMERWGDRAEKAEGQAKHRESIALVSGGSLSETQAGRKRLQVKVASGNAFKSQKISLQRSISWGQMPRENEASSKPFPLDVQHKPAGIRSSALTGNRLGVICSVQP